MNTNYVFNTAKIKTPYVEVEEKQLRRHEIVNELVGKDNIGIELGVAEGIFSARMLESQKFKRFYGVDVYGDSHDTNEYIRALRKIGYQNPQYCLLRMDFYSALELFPDEYFDFIYVDGFAHTGEDGGKIILEWYGKLKVGGIIAGDDYHKNWPLVVWAVNRFATQLNQTLFITTRTENTPYCKYPTWYVIKNAKPVDLTLDPLLFKISQSERKRIHRKRMQLSFSLRRNIIKVLDTMHLKNAIKRIFSKFKF